MERTERMIGTLCEEWENVIVLCSKVDENGQTAAFRFITGNHLANQQLLEDTIDDVVLGFDVGGSYGAEEAEA